MLSRRHFMQTAGLFAVSSLVSASSPGSFPGDSEKKKHRYGVQLFTIPGLVDQSLQGALKAVADAGYKEVEFFGPYPFSPAAAHERWKPLAAQLGFKHTAYYGLTPKEVRQVMDDLGLRSPSMHADLLTIRESLEKAAEAAHALDQKWIIVPAVLGEVEINAESFRKLAAEFNAIGKRARELGIRFAYHNHGYEHAVHDGRTLFDILLKETDPELVDFELDIFWMTAGGGDPIEFLKNNPGRFRLMHLKDMIRKVRFSGAGSTPQEWMALFPQMSDPGRGVLDLPGIIQQAAVSGVRHFYLERDLAPEPLVTLKESYKYLSGVK